ncbi:hypothetical protein HDF16_001144 [Granulicella aggregans]|uniref:Uncharacterized protein n=1 Tax=Granulicella aggregans TaxID=474949 RepID=A0A7W7ZBC3_9BACT|nr:hypothetical protein [Granulicella aggregans]MBB5056459.1 hypothetical protein [Granulicella aggregans]
MKSAADEKPIQGSHANPRFLFFLKAKKISDSEEPPAKDSRRTELAAMVLCAVVLFAIVVLVFRAFHPS